MYCVIKRIKNFWSKRTKAPIENNYTVYQKKLIYKSSLFIKNNQKQQTYEVKCQEDWRKRQSVFKFQFHVISLLTLKENSYLQVIFLVLFRSRNYVTGTNGRSLFDLKFYDPSNWPQLCSFYSCLVLRLLSGFLSSLNIIFLLKICQNSYLVFSNCLLIE